MRSNISPKTIRCLVAADGYLDLDMPEQALRELQSIDDAGFYEAPRQFLIGRAMKMQFRFDEAIQPLEKAARKMPSPFRRAAWAELVECYRSLGNEELAQIAETLSRPADGMTAFKLVLPEIDISLEERPSEAS